MALDTIGSIATHLAENFSNVTAGVSGNLVEIVDMARQDVSNHVGADIGSNSIAAEFQPAILSFSKADVTDLINAQAGGDSFKLAELTVTETTEQLSAEQWRVLGNRQLANLGRKARFARSIS